VELLTTPINKRAVNTFDEIAEKIKSGEINGFIFAGYNSEGKVETGWALVTAENMAELMSHLQVDMIKRMYSEGLFE
jgi:hypothetical protein